MSKPRDTEVDAYIYIKKELKNLGWNTRNPDRDPRGQVYTQNECLGHPEIKKALGLKKPENIVKLSETEFWVIEAKRSHKQLEQALNEAMDYASKINNKSKNIKAVIVSGVAGNETDGYFVKTEYFDKKIFKPITINKQKVSSLLSYEIIKNILETNNPNIEDVPIDEKLFLSKAEKINGILHLGAINKNYRARVMAALLLSLIDETPPNVDASPKGLIKDINNRAENVLENEDKKEFFPFIEIILPASPDNHVKFKKALVHTIQELNNLNIRSAMNSGTDVLGKFYEVFLKYGNGAKEIGIVLTPRHITKFATNALDIKQNDIIFDPTCGTGGFLVSAFDYVKKNASEQQLTKFKERNIYGIEQEPEVIALAIVNMIFRGDGKNNLIEGNCFQKHLTSFGNSIKYFKEYQSGKQVVTKVLMNPPFALKGSDEKEYKFIDCALKQMQHGGILFSVLPYSAMSKSTGYDVWRKNLIKNHTLLSVIKFPEDLFYPIGVFTLGIFMKKGIPHPKKQNVLWIRALNDGFLKKKGKRLPNEKAENDFIKVNDILKSFIANPNMQVKPIQKFMKTTPINFDDPRLELVPEVYLDDNKLTKKIIENEMIYLIKEVSSFKIKYNEFLYK